MSRPKTRRPTRRRSRATSRPFLVLWTLAVVAGTSAFCLYIGLRTKSLELGYELGQSHSRLARLREVKRVLELEVESYKTPERVDLIARTLLGMAPPPPRPDPPGRP